MSYEIWWNGLCGNQSEDDAFWVRIFKFFILLNYNNFEYINFCSADIRAILKVSIHSFKVYVYELTCQVK